MKSEFEKCKPSTSQPMVSNSNDVTPLVTLGQNNGQIMLAGGSLPPSNLPQVLLLPDGRLVSVMSQHEEVKSTNLLSVSPKKVSGDSSAAKMSVVKPGQRAILPKIAARPSHTPVSARPIAPRRTNPSQAPANSSTIPVIFLSPQAPQISQPFQVSSSSAIGNNLLAVPQNSVIQQPQFHSSSTSVETDNHTVILPPLSTVMSPVIASTEPTVASPKPLSKSGTPTLDYPLESERENVLADMIQPDVGLLDGSAYVAAEIEVQTPEKSVEPKTKRSSGQDKKVKEEISLKSKKKVVGKKECELDKPALNICESTPKPDNPSKKKTKKSPLARSLTVVSTTPPKEPDVFPESAMSLLISENDMEPRKVEEKKKKKNVFELPLDLSVPLLASPAQPAPKKPSKKGKAAEKKQSTKDTNSKSKINQSPAKKKKMEAKQSAKNPVNEQVGTSTKRRKRNASEPKAVSETSTSSRPSSRRSTESKEMEEKRKKNPAKPGSKRRYTKIQSPVVDTDVAEQEGEKTEAEELELIKRAEKIEEPQPEDTFDRLLAESQARAIKEKQDEKLIEAKESEGRSSKLSDVEHVESPRARSSSSNFEPPKEIEAIADSDYQPPAAPLPVMTEHDSDLHSSEQHVDHAPPPLDDDYEPPHAPRPEVHELEQHLEVPEVQTHSPIAETVEESPQPQHPVQEHIAAVQEFTAEQQSTPSDVCSGSQQIQCGASVPLHHIPDERSPSTAPSICPPQVMQTPPPQQQPPISSQAAPQPPLQQQQPQQQQQPPQQISQGQQKRRSTHNSGIAPFIMGRGQPEGAQQPMWMEPERPQSSVPVQQQTTSNQFSCNVSNGYQPPARSQQLHFDQPPVSSKRSSNKVNNDLQQLVDSTALQSALLAPLFDPNPSLFSNMFFNSRPQQTNQVHNQAVDNALTNLLQSSGVSQQNPFLPQHSIASGSQTQTSQMMSKNFNQTAASSFLNIFPTNNTGNGLHNGRINTSNQFQQNAPAFPSFYPPSDNVLAGIWASNNGRTMAQNMCAVNSMAGHSAMSSVSAMNDIMMNHGRLPAHNYLQQQHQHNQQMQQQQQPLQQQPNLNRASHHLNQPFNPFPPFS